LGVYTSVEGAMSIFVLESFSTMFLIFLRHTSKTSSYLVVSGQSPKHKYYGCFYSIIQAF